MSNFVKTILVPEQVFDNEELKIGNSIYAKRTLKDPNDDTGYDEYGLAKITHISAKSITLRFPFGDISVSLEEVINRVWVLSNTDKD